MSLNRRSLTMMVKVAALISALAWATESARLASAAAITSLLALTTMSLRNRPAIPRSGLTLILSLVIALVAAVIVGRAWTFVPAVLAVWAGAAALAVLVWLARRPALPKEPVAITEHDPVW